MSNVFSGPLAGELLGFLEFKRALGYGYARAKFTLREFDRFLIQYVAKNERWQLDQAAIDWLSSKPGRKTVSVSGDAAVLRQFFRYLRRSSDSGPVNEPIWPRLPTQSSFVPYFLSEKDILTLLKLCADLKRPHFRAALYRALILVLYCTGIRFGEALRLRMRDVDTRSAVLFIDTFKRRTRWVPFHSSLSQELGRYLVGRVAYATPHPDARFFVGANRERLPVETASDTLRRLFKLAGLKPEKGRAGPRPYDLRHAFAMHRLSRWYRKGVDLYSRLPWLSAYMGHVDIIGTETYLNATPELLTLAGNRLRRRYNTAAGEDDTDEPFKIRFTA
jgi:integrase/recombinase XerD